jgi:hypothetical protein
MRTPSKLAPVWSLAMLVAILLASLGVASACNPAIQPSASEATAFGDDASALAAGDDSGWSDDGDDAGDPPWDAVASIGVDAVGPLSIGDSAAADTSTAADAMPDAPCTQPLGAGDLFVDELMIESVDGAGDDGEWLEVQSTAACAVNLRGLHGECPVGAKVHTFDVSEDIWIPPGSTFIVADSADPAVNHYLPGLVLSWAGQPGDVLRNEGGTVTLSDGNVLVVSLTWPALKPIVGASVELPADCPVDDVDDFDEWQTSTSSWFPGFLGTPNAPNTDVMCQ